MFFPPAARRRRRLTARRKRCRPAASVIPTASRPRPVRIRRSTSHRLADSTCPLDQVTGTEPEGRRAPAAWLPAPGSVAALLLETPALHLREQFAKPDSAMPMWLLLRQFSRVRQPRQRLKWSQRKSFPSRFPSTLKKPAPSELKAKSFLKSYWKLAEGYA